MPNEPVDWVTFREQFPIFKSKIYINSCSYGALCHSVENGFQTYLKNRHQLGSHWQHWVGELEALRVDFASLFTAMPDEIAITASASAGINSVASSLDFTGKRNKVVISELEFPTNAQIWFAQEKHGANVVRVGATKDQTLLERMDQEIDETTRIVAITHVCYRNGEKLPIEAIRDLARKSGALILVDGYQAIGSMQLDLTKLDVDFYVGGTLKYLLGTAGIAFLYANQKVGQELTPSHTGWFAQNDIHAMDDTRYAPSTTARRFEAGTPPVPNIHACRAALAMIRKVGLPAIENRIAELTAHIISGAETAGYKVVTPVAAERHGAMIAIKTTHEHEVVQALEERDIITSCRDGNLRISPHVYNTKEDIDAVFAALKTCPQEWFVSLNT